MLDKLERKTKRENERLHETAPEDKTNLLDQAKEEQREEKREGIVDATERKEEKEEIQE